MENNGQPRQRRGQSNIDFIAFFLAVFGLLVGILLGADYGSRFGVLGGLLGALVGAVVGFLGTLLATFLLTFALLPLDCLLDRFSRWWCPYVPACENGTCVEGEGYSACEIPEEVVKRVKGLCRTGYRCKCGHVYATGYDYGMQRRFIRVLPDGTIRPYLRHRIFGRWRPDEGQGIVELPPDYVEPAPLKIPGWTVPCLCMLLCGGIAFYVVYLRSGNERHPVAPWFVLGATLLGFASGCIAWWIGPPKKH